VTTVGGVQERPTRSNGVRAARRRKMARDEFVPRQLNRLYSTRFVALSALPALALATLALLSTLATLALLARLTGLPAARLLSALALLALTLLATLALALSALTLLLAARALLATLVLLTLLSGLALLTRTVIFIRHLRSSRGYFCPFLKQVGFSFGSGMARPEPLSRCHVRKRSLSGTIFPRVTLCM
jgi:hypothetical protein